MVNVSQDLDELISKAMDEWYERFLAGPRRLRWDELPPQIGDPAPNLELLDSTGESRYLNEFWAHGPALVLLWRNFGCGCGTERAERLADEYEDYIAAGASVVVVGIGDPERAAAYAEKYGIECPVLCDSRGTAHERFGLLDFSKPQVWYDVPYDVFSEYEADPEHVGKRALKVTDERGRPKVDDPWQQPGEFVVDGDGVLQLTYRYQYCRDFPDHRVLTTAIEQSDC